MKIKDAINKIEEKFPLFTQSSWDNSGIQVGDLDADLKGIYICMDAEVANVKEAIDLGANLILAHHPFIFSGIKSLVKGDFSYEIIDLAIKNNLTIYACHTPFDASAEGMKATPLLKMAKSVDYDFVNDEDQTFGVVMETNNQSLEEIEDVIKVALSKYKLADITRIYQANDKPINRIAYMGGSGASYIGAAAAKGADLYITGDVKYHDAQLAKRLDLNLIDLGHDQSEMHFVDIMADYLKDFSNIHKTYKTFR